MNVTRLTYDFRATYADGDIEYIQKNNVCDIYEGEDNIPEHHIESLIKLEQTALVKTVFKEAYEITGDLPEVEIMNMRVAEHEYEGLDITDYGEH